MTRQVARNDLQLPGLTASGSQRYVRPYTRVGLSVYPHSGDPVFPNRSTDAIDIDWRDNKHGAILTGLRWQKALGGSSGNWVATIMTRSGGLNVQQGAILGGDWVDLAVNRNGVVIPLCRGIVDTVNRDQQAAGGAGVERWILTGRDHGACFDSPMSYSNMFVHTLREIVKGIFTERVGGRIGGSPRAMFDILLRAAFERGTRAAMWKLPDSMLRRSSLSGRAANRQPSEVVLKELFSDTSAIEKVASHLHDILGVKRGATRGGYYNEPVLWHQAGQTVHQTISEWCNPLLNEIIYDLAVSGDYPESGPATARIQAMIRERPFVLTDDSLAFGLSNYVGLESTAPSSLDAFAPEGIDTGLQSPWFKLPTWDIPMWVFQDSNVARSNAERFNLFELIADLGFGGTKEEQQAAAPPSWDYDSVERHGLKPMMESTKYLAGVNGKNAMAGWVTARRDWQKLLVQWHCLNPYLWSGTATSRLAMPEIRVGHRLRILNSNDIADAMTFYVEGVSLDYQMTRNGPASKMDFTLTRGWTGSDRSLVDATARAYAEFEAQQ
jgi:hypothetical protein